MRTDVTVTTEGEVRLPEIPIASPGRNSHAKRGDFIQWRTAGSDFFGRVIGFVDPPERQAEGLLIVVAMHLHTLACERWVEPKDVYDCHTVRSDYEYDKLEWLFGSDFFKTPPDLARQCFDKLADELVPGRKRCWSCPHCKAVHEVFWRFKEAARDATNGIDLTIVTEWNRVAKASPCLRISKPAD